MSTYIVPIQTDVVEVIYSSYPTIDSAPLDSTLLNSLAEQYYKEVNPDDQSSLDFVIVYLPIWAFNTLATPGMVGTTAPYSVYDVLGIVHFSGYWFGIWLRNLLQNPPPAATVDTTQEVQDIVQGLSAVNPLDFVTNQFQEAVASFGYKAGYLRTIRTNPPQGVTPDPTYDFTYDSSSAWNVSYTTPLFSYPLFTENGWLNQLNLNPVFSSLKGSCIQIQALSYVQGQNDWGGPYSLFSVQGFAADDYNILLKASSASLEIAQYNVAIITESIGYVSQYSAAKAATTNTAVLAFSDAYDIGLSDGSYDSTSLPFPAIQITFVDE